MKTWKIQAVDGKLGLTCPNCGGKALVSKKWRQPRTYTRPDGSKVVIVGRSCTYCFKTARLP